MIIAIWLILIFFLGASVGSFLNVCIHRLPYEKSIFWPLGSHCGTCYQPIRWYDNIPLVSYWVLRGRCRVCGAWFSARYFFVELLTGLSFAGLLYLEVIRNIHNLPAFNRFGIDLGFIPVEGWLFFSYHALLVSFLIVITFCDIDHLEIPLPVTVSGTLVGVLGGMLLPWPWPNTGWLAHAPPNPGPVLGLQPWPLWYPLPAWLEPGTWQTGLLTSVAGMLAGTLLLRAVRFVFGVGRGIEGMGVGDADLMMMAGSFLGWQPIVVAFFVSVVPAFGFAFVQLVRRGNEPFPFGPSLALGVIITLLCWQWFAPVLQPVFFDGLIVGLLFGFGGVALLLISFMLRVLSGGAGTAGEET